MHLRAENVGRHQVGRELDAARGQPEHGAERLDQLGLGKARHADEQPVPAGQDGDQRPLDDRALAVDDLADRLARRLDAGDRGVGFGNDAVGVGRRKWRGS